MARLIFISPYMKGGRDAARLAHRTRYFATREGVQLLKDDNAHLPVTKKQQQYIQRLLRSFPEARELPEHEDYANTPNRQTAFALIAQIHEDFIEPMDGRENYLDYVANRPGVKALGEHGLWDAHGKVPSLENAVAEVARHTGNVWTPIISLSRENAERLGYTDLKNWQELINASITDIAKGYKIHPDRLRWYAATMGQSYRGNIEGSDPRHSFHYLGGDDTLYVFETPIDLLSYISLFPEGWQEHNYVACCGTSSIPVLEMLRQFPQLRKVSLCMDNDAAGHAASERMAKLLEERGISAERLVPQQKDWNDDLKAEQENKMERSELCQTFC